MSQCGVMSRFVLVAMPMPSSSLMTSQICKDSSRTLEGRGIPITVIGGTNLLVRDGGIEGIVVSLHQLQGIRQESFSRLYVGGGVRMPHLLNITTKRGYGGLEFSAGIPGTVAGSVVMNAGTARGEMKDALQEIHLLDTEGRLHVIPTEALEFGYRRSSLPPGVVIGAWLKVTPSQVQHVATRIKALLRKRKQTQPLALPSAGCVFRNPRGDSAGRLIEFSGFKGYRVGDAAISTLHANFAVNVGRATAGEVISLIDQVRTAVNEKNWNIARSRTQHRRPRTIVMVDARCRS